jgi:folate-binding protein YgfZ
MNRSILAPLHEARGARWIAHHGWEIPGSYGAVSQEYHAIQEGVGLIDLSHRTRLKLTGRDRRSWFHGQCSQEINNLADGRATYATIMDPRGRMVSDLNVLAVEDALVLDFPAGTAAPMAEYLDRFLIMERCEIEDLTRSWACLSVQGPHSCHVVGATLGSQLCDLGPWEIRELRFDDEPLYALRIGHCGEDGFDLMLPSHHSPSLWAALCQPRTAFAVHSAGWEALNLRRLEAGIPWWGEELDASIVPLEARLDHAISLHKGCYIGQEIIARIDARGHVNNLLGGFFVAGESLPPRGATIHHEGRPIGRVVSAFCSPRLQRNVGLGFFRREQHDEGTRLSAKSDAEEWSLAVTSLPFVPHDYPIHPPE